MRIKRDNVCEDSLKCYRYYFYPSIPTRFLPVSFFLLWSPPPLFSRSQTNEGKEGIGRYWKILGLILLFENSAWSSNHIMILLLSGRVGQGCRIFTRSISHQLNLPWKKPSLEPGSALVLGAQNHPTSTCSLRVLPTCQEGILSSQ